MTALSESARPGWLYRARRQWRRVVHWGSPGESYLLMWLSVLAVVMTVVMVKWPLSTPITLLTIPLLVGSLLLGPRLLPWFVVFILLMLMVTLLGQPDKELTPRVVGAVAIQFLLGLIILLASFRRSRLGVGGVMGESMLVDLRDRILRQGGIPELDEGWHAESALRSASGSPFAGDFVVASRPRDGRRFEVVVVDVSGKGDQAGTRALLLSGALGGLLSAMPPEQFLPAANDYLLRQNWEEGFATAVHLSVDLDSGAFQVRTAGHPPAAQRESGSGRWAVLPTAGPVLGLIEDAEFEVYCGELRHGDAVLLYTDGMVEDPRRDIEVGIDRLLGEAETLLRGEFEGAAQRLVDARGSRDDDRAILVVSRL